MTAWRRRLRTWGVVPAGKASGSSCAWRRVKWKVLLGILPRTWGEGVRGGGSQGMGVAGERARPSRLAARRACASPRSRGWRRAEPGARTAHREAAQRLPGRYAEAPRRVQRARPPELPGSCSEAGAHLVQIEVHRGRRVGRRLLVDEADAAAAVDGTDDLAAAWGGRGVRVGGGAGCRTGGGGSSRGRCWRRPRFRGGPGPGPRAARGLSRRARQGAVINSSQGGEGVRAFVRAEGRGQGASRRAAQRIVV
jgi:hypothetical protein